MHKNQYKHKGAGAIIRQPTIPTAGHEIIY
jgi:hypothetical protein